MANLTFTPPADGAAVTMQNGRLCVPDRPVIPFIIGDGTGPEIWAAASRVIDAAVAKAYQGRRSIAWYEVFAGQKSFDNLGTWLPNETVEAFREKTGYTFPMGLDSARTVYDRYATDYIPRNFLIDKQGKVILATVGYDDEEFDALIRTIEKTLEN